MALPPEELTPEGMLARLRGLRLREDGGDPRPGRRDRRGPDDGAEASRPGTASCASGPCFHDEYLQAFNEPSTHLVDTDGKGVERITETGVVVAGVEYEVDCIIYASGFEVGTAYTRRAGFDLTGRDGVKLSEYWADGMRTKHGIHVHGFPNLFIVQPTQGANLISNVPHNLTEAGQDDRADRAARARRRATTRSRSTKEAEDAWIELLLTGPGHACSARPDCTPGYYNNEGQDPGSFLGLGYPGGPMAYFQYLDEWRAPAFDGLEFR